MPLITGLYLNNLPVGISEKFLIAELTRIFPNAFKIPHETGQLKVKLFKPKGQSQTAVLSGFCADFDHMKSVASNYMIGGRSIRLKPDSGDARDEYGKFLHPIAPSAKRESNQMEGISNKKAIRVFSSSFLENVQNFTGFAEKMYFNSSRINRDVLETAGKLTYIFVNSKSNTTRVQYDTSLETLQAICLFSNNPKFGNMKLFRESGEVLCENSNNKGIGTGGSILYLKNRNRTALVSFDQMDFSILDLKYYRSICWKCKFKYNITGVQVDFNYLAGVCKCKYVHNLEVTSDDRAYFWKEETFTRLCLGQRSDTLIVMHTPMMASYESARHYQQIVLPVLQEEWMTYSRGFIKENTSPGQLVQSEFVEAFTTDSGRTINVHAIQIIVEKTKFWTPDNTGAIGKVTLEKNISYCDEVMSPNEAYTTNGTVKWIIPEGISQVRLLIQVKTLAEALTEFNGKILVVPNPNKNEYNSITQLVTNIEDLDYFYNLFVNPSQVNCWKLENSVKHCRFQSLPLNIQEFFAELKRNLNNEQKTALANAANHKVSFIHGPPGTGKTYTLAACIIQLSFRDGYQIIACAPSNVAADEIASRIQELSGDKRVVVRMYSKKREMRFLAGGSSVNKGFLVLHEEIQKCENWLETQQIADIIAAIKAGKGYTLTRKEIEAYEYHVAEQETLVLSRCHIIAMTVGTLLDTRMSAYSKRHPIFTVAIDEAGKLTSPATLSALVVKPKRLIIVGDHLQLRAITQSYSAEIAGLSRSLMEWVADGKTRVPWTSLLEQHRMAPGIRKLVSAVTYNNLLTDSTCIALRKIDITCEIYKEFPQLKVHPVLVYDHRNLDARIGTSFRNTGEANMVINAYQKMLRCGVPVGKVTILTFYEEQRILLNNLAQSLKITTEILNVDSFQGKENSIILISCVRSNNEHVIGFASNMNRLNVALSRAKHFLLLFCNIETFKNSGQHAWTMFCKNLECKVEAGCMN